MILRRTPYKTLAVTPNSTSSLFGSLGRNGGAFYLCFAGGFRKEASFPSGNTSPFFLSLYDGSMAMKITASATVAETILAYAFGSDNIEASSTVLENGDEVHNISINASGGATASFPINGVSNLQINMSVANLNQNEISGAVLDTPIEGNFTLRQLIQLMSAVQLGNTTIDNLGGGNAQVSFKDIDSDGTVRVEAQMSGSQRTSVTKNTSG